MTWHFKLHLLARALTSLLTGLSSKHWTHTKMNPAYPQNAYPGFRPGTQPPPPPGMPMMDPNLAQIAQQRYMQQHQQQLAAMHAAGVMQNGGGFPGGPQGAMRMPPGMPMTMPMQGMNMNMGMGMGMGMQMSPGQGGPSSHQPPMPHGHQLQQPPKQRKKPGVSHVSCSYRPQFSF